MSLTKTPVKGMCDMLPSDMRLRQKVSGMIREAYSGSGFMEIETPVMEHIENLTSKQGGDNEKLIFKVMKRGADLGRALEKQGELADFGLRYDLTLPLARYYSNNKDVLPSPFKALQIGNVWRADKPQKGRFRQFTQCDIDILGDSSALAEIELISATGNMLKEIFELIGGRDFTVHVNDRRLLTAAAISAGFSEEDTEPLLISLDKADKIGFEGVKKELIENGYDEAKVDNYLGLYAVSNDNESASSGSESKKNDLRSFAAGIGEGCISEDVIASLEDIIKQSRTVVPEGVSIVFDPSLVRGMGYYTGTIFEVTIDGYNFSIAGGGRYDKMIGRFTGQDTPAVGFSIGFERIITILKDELTDGFKLPEGSTAILIGKKVSPEGRMNALKEASELRKNGTTVIIQPMQKNLGHQIESLEKEGYTEFKKIYE